MDLVSCGFCRRSLLNIFGCFPVKCVSQILHMKTMFEGPDFIRIFLKVFHWTEFNKQYISWLYLMDLIFMLLFRRFVLSQTNIFLKKMFYLIQWNPFKNDQKCFLFHLKAFFVLKIFKFLSWLFGHILLTDQAWLSDCLYFLIYWTICVLQLSASELVT